MTVEVASNEVKYKNPYAIVRQTSDPGCPNQVLERNHLYGKNGTVDGCFLSQDAAMDRADDIAFNRIDNLIDSAADFGRDALEATGEAALFVFIKLPCIIFGGIFDLIMSDPPF